MACVGLDFQIACVGLDFQMACTHTCGHLLGEPKPKPHGPVEHLPQPLHHTMTQQQHVGAARRKPVRAVGPACQLGT